MKRLLIAFTLIIASLSCSKETPQPTTPVAVVDPCAGISCLNGGTCVNGSCLCPQGYSGPDCSVQVAPKKITVTKIEVLKFPATEANGASWDVGSGADILPVIAKNPATLYTSPVFFENANPSLTYSFTQGFPIEITAVQEFHQVYLYDFDSGSENDFMEGIEFTPWFNGGGFPSTRTLQVNGSDLIVRLSFSYTF